jgi:hypothetical protein
MNSRHHRKAQFFLNSENLCCQYGRMIEILLMSWKCVGAEGAAAGVVLGRKIPHVRSE